MIVIERDRIEHLPKQAPAVIRLAEAILFGGAHRPAEAGGAA